MTTQIPSKLGTYAPDFEIPGTDGTVHHLARYLEQYQAVVVVFMCNHCPYVTLYLDRLKDIQQTFKAQGATLIGINPNDAVQFPADSYDQMKIFDRDQSLNFPYLRDENQDVAHAFEALKTPQVFLLDAQGVVRYQGAIDDNAQDPNLVTQTYLTAALIQVLAGQEVTQVSTDPVGCSIKWRA